MLLFITIADSGLSQNNYIVNLRKKKYYDLNIVTNCRKSLTFNTKLKFLITF